MNSWVSSLLCTTKTGLKISFMPSSCMIWKRWLIFSEDQFFETTSVSKKNVCIFAASLPSFFQLIRNENCWLPKIHEVQKHHARSHARSTFWRSSYLPKIRLACVLVDQKKVPVANPIFFRAPQVCGNEYVMWPCHFLILKNVVDSIN